MRLGDDGRCSIGELIDISVLDVKEMKAKLAAEDEEAVRNDAPGIVHRNMTLSSFILHGIDIREAQ